MLRELSLACFLRGKKHRKETGEDDDLSDNKINLEHINAWLLAESVHSSLRFNFRSHLDLDSMNINSSNNTATVLMVNLDNGFADSLDLKWKRMKALERSISPVANTLVRLSYGEIVSATRNFSKGRILGRGALSCVFRGRVDYLRTAVAIKRLDMDDKESPKTFCRELMVASSLHSPNVAPLVGYCIDSEEGLFLVYKFVSGGSLECHLHGRNRGLKAVKASSSLPWSVRYKIAVGIAEAVAYLHNGTERCILHRDIKPSNILLSSKKVPKLCDFGLATWTTAPSVPLLCKTVKGTFGYLAPEYFQHGKVSDKTDVYALGVVLLELITGRKPIEARSAPGEEESLVLWAKPLLERGKAALKEVIDPRIKLTRRNSNKIIRMAEAAAACINNEDSRRPNIEEVLSILKGEESVCFSDGRHEVPVVDFCSQQLSKGEMKSHMALAMLGVSEFEDDDRFYCR